MRIIEFLAFENANLEYKKILGPLKIRSVPMDEWILHTMDIEIFDYNTESWVVEAISRGMRRRQNAKCFNCGGIGHLRRDYRRGISRNNISSWMARIGGLSLQVYVEGVVKANIGPINADQQKTGKAT